MKSLKIIWMLLLCLSITSCTKSSKLKSEAKKQMEITFKEVAKDPSSVKLTNEEVVYNDDSLCIIHVDYAGKNGLGTEINSKFEYVMLSYNGKYYEGFQQLTSDDIAVFKTKDDFEKHKVGQIYEKLSYESALFYLAAVFINTQGREVGNKNGESCNIPVPTGTGSWQIGTFTDEFGEQTNNKFLLLQGSGVFSNSATTNSKLLAALCLNTTDEFSLMLVEYGSNIVKTSDSYSVRIKDAKGEVFNMRMYGDVSSGRLSPSSYDDNATLQHILNESGDVIFSITQNNSYGTPSTYLFKLNVAGYEKAKECCIALKKQAMSKDPYVIACNAYLDKVSKSPQYKKVDGIFYKILKVGSGVIPTAKSTVSVNYEGRLIDGTIFDSTYPRGEPVTIRVDQVIKGWTAALTHMPEGSSWEIVIPCELAYGERNPGSIKPYSTLIFKVDLLKVVEK